MPGLIYIIRNKTDGKCYVGQTIRSLRQRRNEHAHAARNGSAHPLHRAIRKYGIGGFDWDILVECVDCADLNAMESYHANQQSSFVPSGYNIAYAHVNGRGVTALSPMANPEVRERVRQKLRGHIVSPETRQKLRAANLGKTLSRETISKIVAKTTGQRRTLETRRRISDATKGRNVNSRQMMAVIGNRIWLGRRHTPASISKMSLSQKARYEAVAMPSSTKQKIGAANAREVRFVSPEGVTIMVKGLRMFSSERGLNYSAMSNVRRGRMIHHRGWTCPDAPRTPHRIRWGREYPAEVLQRIEFRLPSERLVDLARRGEDSGVGTLQGLLALIGKGHAGYKIMRRMKTAKLFRVIKPQMPLGGRRGSRSTQIAWGA